MNLDLTNLLDSKRYVTEGSNIQYMHPRDLINPFLDTLNYDTASDKITVQTQNAIVNENDDGSQNAAYPRFLIALNKGESFMGYDNTYGLIVAMDRGTPLMKVYSGQEVQACTNLCIWNAEHVFQQNLNADPNFSIQMVRKYFEEKEKQVDEYRKVHTQLVETYWSYEELQKNLGRMLLNHRASKLGSGPLVGVSALLSDGKSKYSVPVGESTSMYNVYNAFTQTITNGSQVVEKPNKTLLVGELMGIN